MSTVVELGGDSMGPALPRGSRVLVAPLRREIRAGDVVALRATDPPVLHRVVLTFEEDGQRWLVHRGDNGGRSAAAPAAAVFGHAIGTLPGAPGPIPTPDELPADQRRGYRWARWRARAYVLARLVVRAATGRPAYNVRTLTLRIAPGVAWRLLDGEAAVIDLERGRTLGLNRTASLVWSMLDDHDEPAIVEAVVARFQVDPETARADIRQLLETLREQGFLAEA